MLGSRAMPGVLRANTPWWGVLLVVWGLADHCSNRSIAVANHAAQAGGEASAKRKPLVALARESIVEYSSIVKRVVTDTARVAVQRAAGLGGAAAPGQQGLAALEGAVEFKEDWGADTIAQVGADGMRHAKASDTEAPACSFLLAGFRTWQLVPALAHAACHMLHVWQGKRALC